MTDRENDRIEARLTFDELKAKYGPNWGIGTDDGPPQGKKERAFRRYADDELRAMYRASEGENG